MDIEPLNRLKIGQFGCIHSGLLLLENVTVLIMMYHRGNFGDNTKYYLIQGMVDGSASKPALRQDTGYIVEKTYHDIAPYLGAFVAYLMPQ